MAGGRFLSGDDPTISPDARIRASVGVGNDCEPYVDPIIGLAYPIAPPGVQLPSCFALDNTRGAPGVAEILERVYAGSTPQVKAVAIGELERLALERFAATQKALMTYNATELAFFREQQRRIDAGLPIITAAQLAPLTGGSMSSMFGITTSLGSSVPTTGFLLPALTPGAVPFLGPLSDPTFLGGALGTAAQVAAQIFLQRQQEKAAEDAFKRQLQLLMLGQNGQQPQPGGGAGAGGGQVVVNPDGTLGMAPAGGMAFGPSWAGFERCGQGGAITVSPMDAPSIYRAGCSGVSNPRGRFYALRANGNRDLFVRVGTVNSVSPRTLTKFARRWAKQAKLTIGGRGGRRGRRRPR